MLGKLLLLILIVLCGGTQGQDSTEPNTYLEQCAHYLWQEFAEGWINIELDKITDGNRFLLLVNREHELPEDFEPGLFKADDMNKEMDPVVYRKLRRMLKDGEAEGLHFVVASGYRDHDYQQMLFDEDVNSLIAQGKSSQEAAEIVARETMPPGCSEHSTGLALDIVSLDYQVLDEKQADTPEIQWLQDNCANYGFILRYPKGKEDITGIDYESWHFRYVGEKAAKEISEAGITLEEYLNGMIVQPEELLAELKTGYRKYKQEHRFCIMVRKLTERLEECRPKIYNCLNMLLYDLQVQVYRMDGSSERISRILPNKWRKADRAVKNFAGRSALIR